MTPRLVAISDRQTASAEATLECFAALGRAARPGSVVFQLRDLELGARERLAFGGAIARLARASEQRFIVNDRVDLALLLGADGVHLGEASLETVEARRLLGERAFVSRACHAPERVAELDADAVVLSPILEARKGRPALGLAGLEQARGRIVEQERGSLLYALGGVSAARAADCLAAGADGVAAIGAVLRNDVLELVRALDIAR